MRKAWLRATKRAVLPYRHSGHQVISIGSVSEDAQNVRIIRHANFLDPGTTVDPTLLRTWMASKESTKGLIDLPDGTVRSEGPRKVQLTQDLNFSNFVVTVSRFRPDETDVTGFPYTDPMTGAETTYELPPYYIEDLEEATRGMRDYVRRARQEYNQLLFTSNPIVRATFAEAERYYTSSKASKPIYKSINCPCLPLFTE